MAAPRKKAAPKADVVPKDLNILQRISGVMSELKFIRKTKTVGTGNYAYKAVTHDEVTKAVHPLLVKYGIVVVPKLVSEQTVETGTTTGNGVPIIRCEVVYDVWFMNVNDRTDAVDARVSAHANDQGDKAPGKAISYAVKAALLKVFNLETGEEEEERIEAQPGPLTKQEVEELQILTEELGFPVEETLANLAKKVYRVDSIELVPSLAFKDAQRRLKKKAADAKRNQPQPAAEPAEENPFGGE